MLFKPLETDLSLYRHFAGQLQSGAVPLNAQNVAEALHALCDDLEAARAYIRVVEHHCQTANARALYLESAAIRAEGRLPCLARAVQEIHWKHTHDKTLTQEEALKHILRLVDLEGAYQRL